MSSAKLLKIGNPPALSLLKVSVELLQQGRVIAFPTETVYGIGAHAFMKSAVLSIYKIKERPLDKTLPVMIANLAMLDLLVAHPVSQDAVKLMQAFWPGPLTLVLPAGKTVPSYLQSQKSTVAVRFPKHPVPLALIQSLNHPLVATSANRSGSPSPKTASEVLKQLGGRIPLILDGGKTFLQRESTILDCTRKPVVFIREGALKRKDIQSVVPC